MTLRLGPPAADHARGIAEQVLADPEYHGHDLDPGIVERIERYVASLFDHIARGISEMPRWLTWLVAGWLTVALLAIVAHSVYTLLVLGEALPAREALRRRTRAGELFGISDLDFDHVYRAAIEARDGKNWERAIRYGYAASILFFDRVGWVAFDASKTNRDYLAEIRSHDRAAAGFTRSTHAFEEVAYGGGIPTERAALGILGDLESIRNELVPNLSI